MSAKSADYRVFNATFGEITNIYCDKYLSQIYKLAPRANGITFQTCIDKAVLVEYGRATRGEISNQSARIFESRCRRYLSQRLGVLPVGRLDHLKFDNLVDDLIREDLHKATIRQILMCAKKVLNWALFNGHIDSLPIMPTVKAHSTPRGGFSPGEYLSLWRNATLLAQPTGKTEGGRTVKEISGGIYSRSRPIPIEMRWLISFMVNSFVRPSDIKNLRHCHIEVVRGTHTYLRLNPPESKRHSETIITLRPAVRIYQKLVEHRESSGGIDLNDFVFYPDVTDRKRAMMAIDHHFRRILEAANLRIGRRGQNRTLYSLRHTALTFRLMFGHGIDLLTLARNARTSVEMVEKFYASELSPEMNVAMLQSRRSSGPN